ncbi:MAG: 50S ribosomal protein L13 [Dehalococcoidia bacterium]|nr:50S ribosomal protein L13 [Dehalococcoidia bacterium]
MRTYSPKLADIQRRWHVIDAAGQPLGRLATQVATILKGKHKAMYSPHLDVGDFVIVVNASKVMVTGKKLTQKMYYRHSMYPSGLKTASFTHVQQAFPERIIEHAVKGMLPHSPLGSEILRKLKVYAGETHPHEAQVNAGRKTALAEPSPEAPAPKRTRRSKA